MNLDLSILSINDTDEDVDNGVLVFTKLGPDYANMSAEFWFSGTEFPDFKLRCVDFGIEDKKLMHKWAFAMRAYDMVFDGNSPTYFADIYGIDMIWWKMRNAKYILYDTYDQASHKTVSQIVAEWSILTGFTFPTTGCVYAILKDLTIQQQLKILAMYNY